MLYQGLTKVDPKAGQVFKTLSLVWGRGSNQRLFTSAASGVASTSYVMKSFFVFAALLVSLLTALCAPGGSPDLRNVKYGPHASNVLDFWFAKNTNAPAPLVVFIHGGGFVAGDKMQANPAAVRAALDGGAAFMSINYRFRKDAAIQDILRDTARAVQFVRSEAARFHIDAGRVACFGGSAGAGSSLWIAVHDNLADLKNPDPVLRQSSRISAAACLNGQASYDMTEWERLIGEFKADWRRNEQEDIEFYHFKSRDDFKTPEGRKVLADCSMISQITSDDPPLYFWCSQPDTEPTTRGHLVHHPRHAQVIEKRCREVGVPVTAVYVGDKSGGSKHGDGGVEAVDFLLENLRRVNAGKN